MALRDIDIVLSDDGSIRKIRSAITAIEFALMPDRSGGMIDPDWRSDQEAILSHAIAIITELKAIVDGFVPG